jgi:hypothetical protein
MAPSAFANGTISERWSSSSLRRFPPLFSTPGIVHFQTIKPQCFVGLLMAIRFAFICARSVSGKP